MAKTTDFLIPNMILALLSTMEDRNNEYYDEVLNFLNVARFFRSFRPLKMTLGMTPFILPFGPVS